MTNGELAPSTLKALAGFAPYPAATNFLPASTTTLSNLVTPAVYIDATNLAAAFEDHFATPLTYAEGYRTLSMQEQRAREHAAGGPLAATPGTSNHGFATAIDYRNNIGTKSSPQYQWMLANAARFGFVNDVATEGWHWHHPSDTALTKLPTTSAASAGEIIALIEGHGMSTATIKVSKASTKTVAKGGKKNAYGVVPRSRKPGNIAVNMVFIVDVGARTIHLEKNGEVKKIAVALNPSGKVFTASGDTIYQYLDSGFKATNW